MNISSLGSLVAEDTWQNQYSNTGRFALFFTVVVVAFVLLNIWRAEKGGRQGKDLYIRRIPGLNAIDEAVGRATEMGRPVVMVPGIPSNVDAIVMQALKIFAYVTRVAANFGNPILVCCAYAPVYTVATEMMRDVYQREGLGDKFDPDSVRFISDRQFAFAAGVSGLMLREQAAAVFLMGDFFAESLIFAETANGIGAIQVASSTQNTQTPFFIAACDYVLIGDEFYAASAYLTRQPVLVGSLIGQDWCKMVVGTLVFIGMALNGVQRGFLDRPTISSAMQDGHMKPLDKPHPIGKKETTMAYLFSPQSEPDLAGVNHRGKYPPEELPESDDKVTNWK